MNPHPDEQCLIVLAKGGDEVALNTLLIYYQPALTNFLYRNFPGFEPEELLQEVLIKISQCIHNFSDSYDFTPWIFMVCRRRAIDIIRTAMAYTRAKDRFQVSMIHVHSEHLDDDEVGENDLRKVLSECMGDLPPLQAQVLRLVADGRSQREIAAMTDAPLGTVKTRIELAVKVVKKALLARGYARNECM